VIDRLALLAELQRLVGALVDDLRAIDQADPETADGVTRQHELAWSSGRTALARSEWAEGLYAQVAVAWVLGAVFIRFCEDNSLESEALLSGTGPRRRFALEHRMAHLRDHPDHDDRHWLRAIFDHYRDLPATGEVFGGHNPVWLLAPSADGARQIVQTFQAVDPDTGELRHDFTDPMWDTRFLGDLYQDLSEHAKKAYALLQTPVFVEEFILERTLEPALATFGLADTTVIDPTCGSGHFLLGAFAHLFRSWCEAEPGTNHRELAQRSLNAIGGVDLNPFAASIARFRLLVAALRVSGITRLSDAPAYPIHVAVGDSLLHGDPPGVLPGTLVGDEATGAAAHGYATEDVEQARVLLSRSWSVVVGNPPYITVKDPALNALYRARFHTCRGKYSLGVPFTERFSQLARPANGNAERAGFVGLITANSFMKREMGRTLIEKWVPSHDLTHLIDTSGAYIPGHGTPTVILFGRNRRPVASTVRAVMSIRGEPSTPDEPEKGLVWLSIVELVDEPGSQSDYVSVVDFDRNRLAKHPWSIGGGGAAELKERLDRSGGERLSSLADAIGVIAICGEDEVALYPLDVPRRVGLADAFLRPLVYGEVVRDWSCKPDMIAYFPYDETALMAIPPESRLYRWLWPFRATMWARATFSKRTYRQEGRPWWEWHQVALPRLRTPLSITFAFVATHNHFVLDRGGKVFKQSALVIKLPSGADEQRHLELLGVLNSSTACFWMKQVFSDKGNGGIGGGIGDEGWERRYEHDGTKLRALPLPPQLDAATAALLDRLSGELAATTPSAVVASGAPSAESLAVARRRYDDLRARMIAAQERLDWETYRAYALVEKDLTTGDEPEPPLKLGERAFEIVLARRVTAGDITTAWFERHRSVPITDLPEDWPEPYRRVVERRIELIESDPNVRLIEQPQYKRRWSSRPWDDLVAAALRNWLLDRLESPRYWLDPATIRTVAHLAAAVRTDLDFMQVAALYAGRVDVGAGALVGELVRETAVPYLAALRFTDSGRRKHTRWRETWDRQRREDAGDDVGEITVPPKYAKTDFVGSAWEHRGKLDLPKERFISYPGAERETDASLPIGWAGWDHLARARALAAWYLQAKTDGRDTDHLMPMLAGLSELLPWLLQWHDDPDPDPALDRPGSQVAALVAAELRAHHLTEGQLAAWRPPPARRGRRPRVEGA
jgi:uncharacterized protein DUF7008/Eco57I restriction-modification methylase